MSWLDEDAYAEDRAALRARVAEGNVVLVVGHLQIEGPLFVVEELAGRLVHTPLRGPTMPVIDLRGDAVVSLLASPHTVIARASADDSSTIERAFGNLFNGIPFVLTFRGAAEVATGPMSSTWGSALNLVRSHPVLPKLLHEIAATKTLVLLGVDPSFAALLIPSSTATGPHFALMLGQYVPPSLNVRALPVPALDLDHVVEFLHWLQPSPSTLALEAVAPRPLRIESVRLTQIGPYDSLTFTPADSWSVLLGNNGHGKTSLLRAIALGLVGDDPRAQPTAASLLRVGASHGVIEVRVGDREFRTELFREGSSVRVVTATRSPLQALGVTMLGFPALRGGPAPLSSPFSSEPATRPDVGDLLPLVMGGADARIATVRQWISQTRLRAELERSRNAEGAARLDALLDRYFAMLVELLPGLNVRLGRIEPTSGMVWVHTDSGEVPLDALSQGTTAVLGWIGTVLLRLLETHPDSAAPEREPAIVLVDEIDAHMHPEWQHAIVGLVRARLPNLQVIATSHSPLVVGSLGDGKVFRVPSLATSRSVALEALTDRFEHYRADQILTSDAFGLASTVSDAGAALLTEYAALHARTARNPTEEARYQELARRVRDEVPSSPETPRERDALAAEAKANAEAQHANPERALANAQALLALLENKP
jgi:hypothetical protein